MIGLLIDLLTDISVDW